MKKQNRIQEADDLYKEVIAECENSPDPQRKGEAVRALLALSSPDEERSFALLEELLERNPENPEFPLLYIHSHEILSRNRNRERNRLTGEEIIRLLPDPNWNVPLAALFV